VPPLIDQATFDAVQAHLRARNPRVTPARVVSGRPSLPASVFAPTATGCKGRSIPMETLDSLVAEHPADRLLQPERLEACDRKAICSEPLSPLRAESWLRSAFAILF
jgi:site-specific DNA recombinase